MNDNTVGTVPKLLTDLFYTLNSLLYTLYAITDLLFKVGYIPLFVGAIFAIWLLFQLHRFVYECPPGLTRELAASSLACSVALLLGAAVHVAQVVTYPTNFYFYFFLSLVVALLVQTRDDERRMAEEIPVPSGDTASVARGPRRHQSPRAGQGRARQPYAPANR